MRVLLIASIALVLASSALAGDEMVFKGDRLTVRLTLTPCEVPALVAALIAAETQTPPRAAWIKAEGVELRGCWGTTEDKVLIGDEFGNGGFIPMSSFKLAESI